MLRLCALIVRRECRRALFIAVSVALPALGAGPESGRSLRAAAEGLFPIGVGLSDRIPEQPDDWPLLFSQFNWVTPENCLKPAAVQPAPGQFNLTQADAFVDFAVSNRLRVVGHCLVWAKDDRTPPWFYRDGTNTATAEVLLARMKDYIDRVVGAYRGRIAMWDVVNEALDDGTNYLRPSGWSRACGEEFIVKAFEFAHAADPQALLIYNDYNNELPDKRAKLIRLLRSLREQKTPIHAVGLQGHYELDQLPLAEIEATLSAMRELNLKVVVSELDIDVIPRGRWWADGGKYRDELSRLDPYREGCPPEILRRQAEQYGQLFGLFRRYRDVIARVSFWNLHDGESWLNGFPWRRVNHPLLFDRARQPKPAFDAVMAALQQKESADLSAPGVSSGQTTNPPAREPGAPGEPLNWTTQQDHKNMMEQLGIIRLRPGPSGQPGTTNSANYDPAKANPFPNLPEVLTLKNGKKVTTPEMWWDQRRPEIVEDFEREVIGRMPKNVPKVSWTVVSNITDGLVGSLPANGKRLVGHVDNSACPSITVDIRLTVVTPAGAKGPVPVLMMFGGFGGDGFPRPAGSPEPTNRFREFGGPFKDPPSTEQLLAAGWGYATLNPGSIQPDNGAGLTRGIIGLVNRGRPRHPDDWGALRAWAWGAARGLDYLETDPAVDAKKVGIEGVSRFGKAALVAMAFEPRFALVLVGSSGEGGAKLHRRNFGEAVENLTGSGEYHWMAGNFLKYGAAEASFGSRNAGDLPVDAHMLIALCAPRPTFISYGVPERGDANWLDQQGSYMATVAAGPVFRLLGARDLGVTEDYRTATMPPVNTGLLDGELAWRQHDGGHEDRSNMKYFIAWANGLIHHSPPSVSR